MRRTIQSSSKNARNATGTPAEPRQRSPRHPVSGRLAQLGAMMNQSPRVQTQLKLIEEVQTRGRLQTQLPLTATMDDAGLAVAEPRRDKQPAQHEKSLSKAPPDTQNDTLPVVQRYVTFNSSQEESFILDKQGSAGYDKTNAEALAEELKKYGSNLEVDEIIEIFAPLLTAERDICFRDYSDAAEWAARQKVGSLEGKKENKEEEAIDLSVSKLYKVSASSAHHNLALIAKKAASAAHKEYGFSFVNKDTEQADIDAINSYIEHYNSETLELRSGPLVTHGEATHQGAKKGMIQYTVNNRTYSTHAESSQLFPVSGVGIVAGKGPLQMLAVLKRLGKLNAKLYYAVQKGEEAKPWRQVSKIEQKKIETEFQLYMKG